MSDDPVAEACGELTRWLKIATETEVRRVKAGAGLLTVTAGLITEHDQQNQSRRHAQPRSIPPWNPAVANAVLDAHAGVRQLEEQLHRAVTGRPMVTPRAATEQATYTALARIASLAAGTDHYERGLILRHLSRWTTAIRQLPAIDDAPVWERLRPGPGGLPPLCPYCKNYSLAVAVQSGMVMCRFPDCADANGVRPMARMEIGQRSAEPLLAWSDGLVQVAP